MPTSLSTREKSTILFIVCLLACAPLLPHIAQPEHYHRFADQRTWCAIPHIGDVLSNLVFIAAGLSGLYRLRRVTAQWQAVAVPLRVFFAGLLLTGFGSTWYHWAPDSQTIVWDRLPMVIAFAGVIGAFLTQRVSVRVGRLALATVLAAGFAGIALSVGTGDLALYLVVQFGGLLGLLAGLAFARNADDPMPWRALIGWYVLAKALELGDAVVWELTRHLVSGHTLKHLAAGMAGIAVCMVLRRLPATKSPLGLRAGGSAGPDISPDRPVV